MNIFENPIERVSIITPTFNSAKMLRNTMNSILLQKNKNYEWIVISGDKSEETLSVINEFDKSKITLIFQEPKGIYGAVKNGFDLAKYSIIYWINAGDLLMPNTIDSILSEIKNTNENWWTGSASLIKNEVKLVRVDPPFKYKNEYIINGFNGKHLPWIQQESIFFRKELLKNVDLVKFSNFKFAGDYYLFNSFARNGFKLKSINYVIASFTRHDGQISENQKMYWKEVESFTGSYYYNIIFHPIIFLKSVSSLIKFFSARLLPTKFEK